jgi:hypothetical protein
MHHQKQKQEKYKELIEEFYSIETVHENCLFGCIATVFNYDGFMFSDDVAFDAQNLRSLVADEFVVCKELYHIGRLNISILQKFPNMYCTPQLQRIYVW